MGKNLYCPDCDKSIERDDLLMCPSCAAVRPPFGWPDDPLLGSTVDGGRYQVERRLGSGGFGVVYEVLHTLVGQRRAMKVMDQKLVGQADIQRRFIDEWDILDKLEHPHIVRCFEIGILPETRQPFMLLELIRGQSLFDVIWPPSVNHPRRMSPAQAARMGLQVASALAHAHSRGLLHRDLKPDNVLLVVDEQGTQSIKVIDFGIAKILGTATVDRKTSRVVGTPEYMAPEQFNPGQELDGRLDLWQLGAVMFFCITGWPPYTAADDDPLGVYRQMLERKGPGPLPSQSHSPMAEFPGLDKLVARLLASSPKDRPADANAAVQELTALLEGELADGQPLPRVDSGALPGVERPAVASTMPAGSAQNPDTGELQPVSARAAAKVPQTMRRGTGRIGGRREDKGARAETGRVEPPRGAGPTARVEAERATSSDRRQARNPRGQETRDSKRREPGARQTSVDPQASGDGRGGRGGKLGLGLVLVLVLLVAVGGAVAALLPWDDIFAGEEARAPDFVWVSVGDFQMGSPMAEEGRFDNETQHAVTLSRPFFLQTTEVTQGQWQQTMGNNPSAFSGCGINCPVERVSWWDALEYLNRRSVSEGFEKCYKLEGCAGIPGVSYRCQGVTFEGLDCTGYRLPTEAEWEYAARGRTDTPLFSGVPAREGCASPDPALAPIGWYCGNASSQTQSVAQKKANGFGLYDTAGNVTEWVWDWNFGDYVPEEVTDPLGPERGAGRTYRGGSWASPPRDCRVAARGYADPASRHDYLGFRAARTAQ